MLGQGTRRVLGMLALAGMLLLGLGRVLASPVYSGCEECHGAFNRGAYTSLHDGAEWNGSLMDTHVNWVGGECTACHMSEGPGAVYLADSGSDVFTNGCVGCHGREADVTGDCTGRTENARATQHCGSGAGLRRVHERALGEGTCSSCHGSDPDPVGEDVLPWNYTLVQSAIRNACDEDGFESRVGLTGLDNDGDGRRDAADPDCQFPVNPGLNDAWYNPATAGQGFFITVYEEVGIVFLSWFTYDLEPAPEDATATVGHPGHRWLTAQGPFEGDTAVLTVNLTSGGVFDSAEPAAGPPVEVGELTIQWDDCESATLRYQLDGVGENLVPISRVASDNVPLCEMLTEAAGAE